MAKITTNELRKRLSAFAYQWAGASSEKADEKLFTAQFLACFGVQPHQYSREYRLTMGDGSHGFIQMREKPRHSCRGGIARAVKLPLLLSLSFR